MRYYKMAADKGHIDAITSLADCYLNDEILKNVDEAIRYYKKVVDKGHVAAMNSLADCYCEEETVKEMKRFDIIRWQQIKVILMR
jgi:TPR repeat protein